MTSDPAEHELLLHFRDLQEHDLATAPEFATTWALAVARASRRRPWPAPLHAGAIAGGVAATAALIFLLMPDRHPAPASVASLALPAWRAPTDTLMAGAADPSSPSLTRAALPTDALARSFFSPDRENR